MKEQIIEIPEGAILARLKRKKRHPHALKCHPTATEDIKTGDAIEIFVYFKKQ